MKEQDKTDWLVEFLERRLFYHHLTHKQVVYLAQIIRAEMVKRLPEKAFEFKDPRSHGYQVDFNEGFNDCRTKVKSALMGENDGISRIK